MICAIINNWYNAYYFCYEENKVIIIIQMCCKIPGNQYVSSRIIENDKKNLIYLISLILSLPGQ